MYKGFRTGICRVQSLGLMNSCLGRDATRGLGLRLQGQGFGVLGSGFLKFGVPRP